MIGKLKGEGMHKHMVRRLTVGGSFFVDFTDSQENMDEVFAGLESLQTNSNALLKLDSGVLHIPSGTAVCVSAPFDKADGLG